jgi:hypothetical protein
MYHAGCLVGENHGGISECSSSGEAEAHWYPAGLVGVNSGVIFKCYSSSNVEGRSHWPGGLVGLNHDGIISNCYSTGDVSGGGLVGRNSGTISNCYSVGSATNGGLVRENRGAVTDSFWDIEVSDEVSDGGIGKTTAEMQTAGTFLEAGWDFVNIWGIGENQTYPYLRKYSAADINQDDTVNFPDLAILAENWLTDNTPQGP